MPKIRFHKRLISVLSILSGSVLLQGGCAAFLQNEIEALFAASSPDNALAVLTSVFFDLLAPLLY